jgi:FkbM family methyltransferase
VYVAFDTEVSMPEKTSFFDKNKTAAYGIIIASLLFVCIYFLEGSKTIVEFVPILRGEVELGDGLVITTTKYHRPIIIKKDDAFVGQLRFSGEIRSNFDRIIRNLYNEGDIIVEVGAHFGARTINFADRVKKNGKVYAFEPNFDVFSKLKKTIILNDLEYSVSLKDVAISDTIGMIEIEDCLSISKKEDGTYTTPRNITTKCSTLDAEVDRHVQNSINLLAIDIPGSEFSILRGALNILDKSRDIIIVLLFDNDPPVTNAEKEFKKLEKMGFKFYLSDEHDRLSSVALKDLLNQKEVVLVISRKNISGISTESSDVVE